MLHKVPRHLIKTLAGGDNVIIAFEFLFQPLRHINIVGLQFFQLGGNPLVEVIDGNAQLLAPGVVIKRHRRLVLHRPLEIVGGNILTEYPARDLIVLE